MPKQKRDETLKSFEGFESSKNREVLTTERLKLLSIKEQSGAFDHPLRPQQSLIELMHWVSNNFSHYLSDTQYLNTFLHSRMIVDGELMHYCDLNKVAIKPLYRDSFISWNSPQDEEHYFTQGVFLFSKPGLEFITASLWHISKDGESEISSFVIVSAKNYQGYLDLRNDYEDWIVKQDRDNLHIRVIDGEDISYDRDQSWDDIFLPQTLKSEIVSLAENFLNNKKFYQDNHIPYKRGVLLFGPPGCGKSSIIRTIISLYDFKPITVAPWASDDSLYEAFSYAESQSPALLYFEDLDSLLMNSVELSTILNLLDGIETKDGIFIMATANNIHHLPSNLTDRPSRFDRKLFIPLPDAAMATQYLTKWFGKMVPPSKIAEMGKKTAKYAFSYSHLKELYITTMFICVSAGRKTPAQADIDKALDILMEDRGITKKTKKSVSLDRYVKRG
jgi:ATPase family associated with various cellular activities (AAA)